MDRIVGVTEARHRLAELITEAREREVFLVRHGRPVAVLLSVEAYEALRDRLEDLEDELSVLRAGDAVPFDDAGTLESAS